MRVDGGTSRKSKLFPRTKEAISKALDIGEGVVVLGLVFAMVPFLLYSAHRYGKVAYGSKKHETDHHK